MAGAYYGIPSNIIEQAAAFLDTDLLMIASEFVKKYGLLSIIGNNEIIKVRLALFRQIPVLLSKDEYDIINKIVPSASILLNLFCIYNKRQLKIYR